MCRSHGAGAGHVKRKAAERLAERELLAAAQKIVHKPVENPLEALQLFAAEVMAWKDLCAGKVAELQAIRYSSPAGEQLRAEVALWERAMDRCATVLGLIARLNIDDRLARISEAQGERLDMLLAAVFVHLQLTDDQQREGRQYVARSIRELG